MAGQFTLRQATDEQNPFLTRFYGDGITGTLLTLYLQNSVGARTALLGLISQGARFQGDTGCGKVSRVIYAGFEIPEFDSNGARNWLQHNGVATAHPIYKVATLSASTNKVTSAAHGYNNDDPIAFHVRGTTSVLSAPLVAHYKFFVKNKTTNDFEVSASIGGASIDLTADSSGTIFVYKANAGFFDAVQGRPLFFPNLNFTFSRKNYIEILLPAELSTGTDAPTRTKIICRGKMVYDLVETDDLLIETGDPIDKENPALVSFDFLKNDLGLPYSRFNSTSWLAWRNRCDETIPWAGGNNMPTPPAFLSSGNVTINTDDDSVEKTGGVDGTWDAYAFTHHYTSPNATLEFRYLGGEMIASFTSSNVDTNQPRQGVYIRDNILHFNDEVTATPIGEIYLTDKIKISYEYGFFKIYRNGISVDFDESDAQRWGTFYGLLQFRSSGAKVDQILYTPSGTEVAPMQVKRFCGDLTAASATFASDAFEGEISLCPGTSWQDVDGEIKILTTPDRTPVFTFRKENTSTLAIKERALVDTLNYWRYKFRNKFDTLLAVTIIPVIRRELMRLIGRKSEGSIDEWQVLSQSQMERIGETKARLTADSIFGYDVGAFLDSLIVAKGDFVNVVDDLSGHTEDAPALCMVMKESLEPGGDVETRSFDIQSTTTDFYSDDAHGQTQPRFNGALINNFVPPSAAVDLTLTEFNYRLSDGTFLPSLQGLVTFANGSNQRARIYTKSFLGSGIAITPDNSADKFTVSADDIAGINNGDTVAILAIDGGGALPDNFSRESEYFVINKNTGAHSFQLSKTLAGAAITFSNNGTGEIRLFAFSDWIFTNVVIVPDANTMQAAFEIKSLPIGFYLVRAATETLAGVTGSFSLQKTALIQIDGDTSTPSAATNLQAVYDGIALKWTFDASPSPNVLGYQVRDGVDEIVIKFIDSLSFSESLETAEVTRRIYSVSRSGVRSTDFAELTFSAGATNFPGDIQTGSGRSNIGFNPDGVYTGRDTTKVPISVIIPVIDSQIVNVDDTVQVNIGITILNENLQTSQSDSLDKAKIEVFNQFGESVKIITPQPFTGAGLIACNYPRIYADAFEQAYFKIQIHNAFGDSDPIYLLNDGTLSNTPPSVLSRSDCPQNLVAAPIDANSVQFGFAYGSNVDLYRRIVGVSAWTSHATGISSTPYTATTLSPITNYEFQLRASAAGAKRSNIVRTRTLQTGTAVAARVATGSLTLIRDPAHPTTGLIANWTRNATDNTDVEIFVNGSSIGNTGSATTITHTFSSLAEGTTLTVKVRNIWSSGITESEFSNEATETTGTTPTASAPTIDSISYDTSAQQVTVNFTPHGGSGTFKLQSSATQFGTYADVAGQTAISAGAASTTFAQDNIAQTIWYKIARNDVGAPDYSDATSVVIPGVDPARSPIGLTVSLAFGNRIPAILSWTNRVPSGTPSTIYIDRRKGTGPWSNIDTIDGANDFYEDDLAFAVSGSYQWRVSVDLVPGVYSVSPSYAGHI